MLPTQPHRLVCRSLPPRRVLLGKPSSLGSRPRYARRDPARHRRPRSRPLPFAGPPRQLHGGLWRAVSPHGASETSHPPPPSRPPPPPPSTLSPPPHHRH